MRQIVPFQHTGNLAAMGSNYTISDADAQSFVTAAGITSNGQKQALDTLVQALKTASIWAKFNALYPFVGGTATTHKFNLKDPQNLDASYRITFNGTFTHDANGITPGGTSADYADTHLNGSSVLSRTDSHWSFYSRTNSDGLTSDYGASAATEVLTRFSNEIYHDVPIDSDRFQKTNTDSTGLFVGTLEATDAHVYRNGSSLGNRTAAAPDNYPNATMVFCSGFTALARPSSRNLAFGSIGTSLTATDVTNYYNAVQAFQTSLGRNV